MQNYEICKQGCHFVGNDQFSGFFLGPDGQKCFQRVLLRFLVWGSEKLFLGVLKIKSYIFIKLTKNKIFYQLSFLEFCADSEFKIRILRI